MLIACFECQPLSASCMHVWCGRGSINIFKLTSSPNKNLVSEDKLNIVAHNRRRVQSYVNCECIMFHFTVLFIPWVSMTPGLAVVWGPMAGWSVHMFLTTSPSRLYALMLNWLHPAPRNLNHLELNKLIHISIYTVCAISLSLNTHNIQLLVIKLVPQWLFFFITFLNTQRCFIV